jgi:hypothetical protein
MNRAIFLMFADRDGTAAGRERRGAETIVRTARMGVFWSVPTIVRSNSTIDC